MADGIPRIAAVQYVADFAWCFPILAPASWSAVVGASPLPLSYAGRTFIPPITSPARSKSVKRSFPAGPERKEAWQNRIPLRPPSPIGQTQLVRLTLLAKKTALHPRD
jgi:hypothetical protein